MFKTLVCHCARTKDDCHIDARFTLASSEKEIGDGIKECTFTLKIPAGRHEDTGEFKITATNKWASADSSVSIFFYVITFKSNL